MWTAKNRGRYDRSKLRYPSDLTDDEWAHVEPLIPPAKRGGNRRHVDVREVMNGIMYVLSTGSCRVVSRTWTMWTAPGRTTATMSPGTCYKPIACRMSVSAAVRFHEHRLAGYPSLCPVVS
jgi:hypothetical protein